MSVGKGSAVWGWWAEGGLALSGRRGRSVWMDGHFACALSEGGAVTTCV